MGIDNILISNSIYSSKKNFTDCANEYKIKPFNYSVATKWMNFFYRRLRVIKKYNDVCNKK